MCSYWYYWVQLCTIAYYWVLLGTFGYFWVLLGTCRRIHKVEAGIDSKGDLIEDDLDKE